MTSKSPLITVVEGIEDGMERLRDYEVKGPLDSDYDPKSINSLLPTSFSSSEESEIEDSDAEADLQKLELLDSKEEDTMAELPTNSNKDESKEPSGTAFRGRPSSCVFVASLAASLTDDELSLSVTNHFQQWGDLALVKVLRDPSNRPYAFVQYTNDQDAKIALKKAQHTTLNGRTIRCEAAKVNRTLYIATCSGYEVTIQDIKDLLEKYGEIEQTVGNNDSTFRKSNLNKAWFAQFAYRDDAIRAYANLRLDPEWIVEWAQNIEHPSEPIERAEEDVEIDKCSIFVGQLDNKVTKELLQERFERHGSVSEIVLVLRSSNNFAFIKFSDEKAAAAAVERENHAVLLEKTMHVQYRELHHKKKRFNSVTPRLNLAPPPVNLPVRRASTGSGFPADTFARAPMGHFGNAGFQRSSSISGKPNARFPSHRSVSFSNDKPQKFYPHNGEFGQSRRNYGTPNRAEDGTDKQTPLSSPSNQTLNSSTGEAKSMYSATATSVTASENHNEESTNPTMSSYSNIKHPVRRNISHMPPPSSNMMHPPPSYYYYPLPPKEALAYEHPSAFPLAYASYPYFYPDSGMVEYPQPAGLSAGGTIPPAPYYMYYSVPQTPTFPPDPKLGHGVDEGHFEPMSPDSYKDEIDY